MRSAPAVQAVSCGTGAGRRLQAACHALAAGSLVAWLGGWLEAPSGWTVLAAVAVGVAAAFAADRRWPSRTVSLAWDGAVWSVGRDASLPGQPTPVLDLGDWMLLRFDPDRQAARPWRRSLWLRLSARDVPAWPALRAALYAAQVAPRRQPAADAGPAAR
jgi:hypothetical protein